MNTPTLFTRLCAAVVLLMAPLSLLGAMNDEIARQLKLTRYVEPLFPDIARLSGLGEGQVALAISRTPDGTPQDILVLSATDPALANAAVDAAREWRFTPTNDPAELASRTVRIGFKLGGVVVYPFGKRVVSDAVDAADEARLRAPIHVPEVHSLAQAPKALTRPMPTYPVALRPKAVEGQAKVRFYVDQEGRVRLPEVTEATTPEFADAALAAVSQWRYEPPQLGSRRVVAAEHWAFEFKANN